MAAAMLSAGLATACDSGSSEEPSDPAMMDDEQLRELDLRAARHGVASLDGNPAFVHVGNLFAYTPPLVGEIDPTDADAIRRQAVAVAHTRLAITFAVIGCTADLQTDEDTTITVDLQGCRLALWELDADVRAVARVEMSPCEAGECAERVVWEMDVGELKSGLIGFPKSGYVGGIDIGAPIDPEERMSWATQPGFAIETDDGLRFDTLSTADWLVYGEDNCVELNMGARLSLEEREDELDELLGDIVISARGIERCPGECATAGDVQLSFGAGHVLRWTHNGDETLTIEAPGGRQLELTPPCAEQQRSIRDR